MGGWPSASDFPCAGRNALYYGGTHYKIRMPGYDRHKSFLGIEFTYFTVPDVLKNQKQVAQTATRSESIPDQLGLRASTFSAASQTRGKPHPARTGSSRLG